MAAPVTRPAGSNEISTNLPKREELSLREVLALPKASSKGLDSSTCSRQSYCGERLGVAGRLQQDSALAPAATCCVACLLQDTWWRAASRSCSQQAAGWFACHSRRHGPS